MASLTLTRLRLKVAANAGLSTTSGGDEETLITEWLNEGYEDAVMQTGYGARRASISLTASESEYSLPTQSLAILDCYIDGTSQDYSLQRVTLAEMIDMRRAQSSAASPPRYFFSEGDYLEIWPAAGTSENLIVYYIPKPTALSSGSDVPSGLPTSFHQLLEWYATWRAFMYDENRSLGEGAIWRGFYDKGLGDLRRFKNQQGGRRLAPAKPGKRTRSVSSDPSVYPRY